MSSKAGKRQTRQRRDTIIKDQIRNELVNDFTKAQNLLCLETQKKFAFVMKTVNDLANELGREGQVFTLEDFDFPAYITGWKKENDTKSKSETTIEEVVT